MDDRVRELDQHLIAPGCQATDIQREGALDLIRTFPKDYTAIRVHDDQRGWFCPLFRKMDRDLIGCWIRIERSEFVGGGFFDPGPSVDIQFVQAIGISSEENTANEGDLVDLEIRVVRRDPGPCCAMVGGEIDGGVGPTSRDKGATCSEVQCLVADGVGTFMSLSWSCLVNVASQLL